MQRSAFDLLKNQQHDVDRIKEMEQALSKFWMEYWRQYSNAGTWQFWVNVILLIVPLLVLYKLLDRKRAFQIGFYGLNIHIWFTHFDSFGTSHGYWEYPYKIMPFLPVSFTLDASLVPVAFMLVYQWSVNRNRNSYLYLIATGVIFAFILKPVMHALNLFKLYEGTNYFHLFIVYVLVSLISLWITNVFQYLQRQKRKK
jgi:hypothetical protein